MAGKTAAQIFGAGQASAPGTARDLFARARMQTRPSKPKTKTNFYSSFKRREGPQTLRIHTKHCTTCGGVTTSVTKHFCAGCHFKGWWWN